MSTFYDQNNKLFLGLPFFPLIIKQTPYNIGMEVLLFQGVSWDIRWCGLKFNITQNTNFVLIITEEINNPSEWAWVTLVPEKCKSLLRLKQQKTELETNITLKLHTQTEVDV